MPPPSGSWLEVSLSRLRDNLREIRARLRGGTQVMAVVKAEAYGHGAGPVARCLYEEGIRRFAVASVDEGVSLRKELPGGEILVLGGCQSQEEEEIFEALDLTAAVFDSRSFSRPLKTQVKINTGMNRLGVRWDRLRELLDRGGRPPLGLYSHFASAEEDREFTRLQLQRFLEVTRGLPFPRHIANTAGLLLPETHLELVRPGLGLYGIAPSPEMQYLKPIQCWKTRLLTVFSCEPGQGVGYGQTWTARRSSRLGVLPVGYADGYNRRLSNRGQVRVRGKLVPVVGRVSMDLTTIDLTDCPEAVPGDEVILLEAEAESPLSANGLARTIQTIPYELLTSIGPRVRRVYWEDP